MTFVDDDNLLITEKTGEILRIDMKTGKKSSIDHELDFYYYGQGGLLDILYNDGYVYVSYSEDRGDGLTSTSIARGLYNTQKIDFKNIFRAEPPISSGYHFGSRVVIKDTYLYASIGERGKGVVAQELDSHAGSIIRINLDGTIPNNPFSDESNLDEIYMIGLRNPQGMAINENGDIYITCLLYTSPSPRDRQKSRMPSSA